MGFEPTTTEFHKEAITVFFYRSHLYCIKCLKNINNSTDIKLKYDIDRNNIDEKDPNYYLEELSIKEKRLDEEEGLN